MNPKKMTTIKPTKWVWQQYEMNCPHAGSNYGPSVYKTDGRQVVYEPMNPKRKKMKKNTII